VVEIERIRAHFLEHGRLGDAALLSTLAEGLRPAEALAVSWTDFDGRRIHVQAHLRDGRVIAGTKRGRRSRPGPARWVKLARQHAADLLEWQRALGTKRS
jgi:integrase